MPTHVLYASSVHWKHHHKIPAQIDMLEYDWFFLRDRFEIAFVECFYCLGVFAQPFALAFELGLDSFRILSIILWQILLLGHAILLSLVVDARLLLGVVRFRSRLVVVAERVLRRPVLFYFWLWVIFDRSFPFFLRSHQFIVIDDVAARYIEIIIIAHLPVDVHQFSSHKGLLNHYILAICHFWLSGSWISLRKSFPRQTLAQWWKLRFVAVCQT